MDRGSDEIDIYTSKHLINGLKVVTQWRRFLNMKKGGKPNFETHRESRDGKDKIQLSEKEEMKAVVAPIVTPNESRNHSNLVPGDSSSSKQEQAD